MADSEVIIAIDIGTTNIKVAAIQKTGTILATHRCSLRTHAPHPGWQEIDPTELWTDTLSLIRQASEGLEEKVVTIGISTHRSTFITWDKDTDEHLHNFITWTDKRAEQMCNDWNNSARVRYGRQILLGVGKLVGSEHAVCAASFRVGSSNVQMRLKWVMDNVPRAQQLNKTGKLCFGTLDTWLVYKLTGGATWATDYTNAGGTGIYDLWARKWCPVMTWLFSNPISALPEVRDCNASYGRVSEDLNLGFSVPIYGVLADQQAAVLGNGLFKKGDVKLTLGTCLSCDIITEHYVHPVATEVYPQIAWKLVGQEVCYLAESSDFSLAREATTAARAQGGRCLDWAVSSGLVEKVEDLDGVAGSVASAEGVNFIGIQTPGSSVVDAMVGVSDESSKAHLVRAVMEAHVFKSMKLIDNLQSFYKFPESIVVDGGGSKSDFILGNTAKLCGLDLLRGECVEGSLMGAWLMAGLGVGWWDSFEDVRQSAQFTTFSSENEELVDLSEAYERWLQCMVVQCMVML